MSKTRITVATVGHMPREFNRKKILSWKSMVFDLASKIESYSLTSNPDGPFWGYSDETLKKALPANFDGDLLLAIVNVPLENNWYARRLSANRAVLSYHEIKEILQSSDIPLENIVYRVLYAYALLYKRSGNRIPESSEITNFTHDETRGCLFDMNGIKKDVIHSCHSPIICPDCVERLKREKVSNETISQCQKEIRNIKKPLFYRMASFVKTKPIWSLIISCFAAIALGVIGSVLGAYLYDALKAYSG